LAIYETDQEKEREEKERAAATLRSRPADEWRWMKYGFEMLGPTKLREKLEHLKIIDQGTGSTFEALEIRGYITMRHTSVPFSDPIPWIRISPKGRKLVRLATDEKRPAKQSVGTLREWHWRALVRAYESYLSGDRGLEDEWSLAKYGGIGWNTWLRLINYKINGDYKPLVKEIEDLESSSAMGSYFLQITEYGCEFYIQELEKYTLLYPDVIDGKMNERT
jgi:hypothetical protein